jgi:N,N-dimethylformamidase
MGGNGFYWRVSYHNSAPGVIELRRAEGGSRAWAPKSGEYYTGFTGEYSGLWRRQGRAGPNVMAGVGFSAEGFDISTYYRRNPDSFNDRVKFMFKGIRKNELIGDFGLIGGGAAGLEIDRVEPHALCVASSENHTDTYLVVVEDILFNLPGVGGQENEFVRGDLCFFETPNGGAVFSVSSMAWVGSLPSNDFDNNVSKLTKNVLDRFADPKPFPVKKAPAPAMKDSYTWRVKGSTPEA